MSKRLNWGILSTAKINQALNKPLRASKRTRLLAVASRSLSTAEAYAREWEIPRAHESYEALLADLKNEAKQTKTILRALSNLPVASRERVMSYVEGKLPEIPAPAAK